MKRLGYLIACLALLAVVVSADGSPIDRLPSLGRDAASGTGRVVLRRVDCHAGTYAAPVYAAPAYILRDSYSYSPGYSYGVGYNPTGELTEVIKLLIDRNDKLVDKHERLLQRMSEGGPGPLKAVEMPVGLRVMLTKCATCHDETVAKAKGMGNVFFQAGRLIDDEKNMARIFTALKTGKMGDRALPKLTADETRDILFFMMEAPPTEPKELKAKAPDPKKTPKGDMD